jgi:hypothetical protein
MRQERRILLEAAIVSVLGHAIFFSVFTVKETEASRAPAPRPPAFIQIAPAAAADLAASRATANPAAADPDQVADVRLEGRTAAPKLELDRTALVWEDEPALAPPPKPTVGPSSWGFEKEPARLRDEFPTDYDAAPSLAAAREAVSGAASGELRRPRIPFSFAFRKVPGAGALLVRPDEAEGQDVRLLTGEIRIDPSSREIDIVVRSSGDPQIDAVFMRLVQKWQFTLGRRGEGFQLQGRLPFPASMRTGVPPRRPPSADELLDEQPSGSGRP